MAKIELQDTFAGYNLQIINNNFQKIATELEEKVLYRDNPEGEPNEMENDLDMNSNRIYNLPVPVEEHEAARLKDVQDAISEGGNANLISFEPYGDITSTNVQGAIQQLEDAIQEIEEDDGVFVRTDTLASSAGAGLVGFTQDASGAVLTTVDTKLYEVKSLMDFMGDDLKAVVRSGVYTPEDHAQLLIAVTAAWESARTTPHNLYAPTGVYELGENSFPWRQQVVSGLLDCANVTIYGDGPTSVFRTNSLGGADVFQLNGVRNLHIRNLQIEAVLQAGASGSGSNGISITGGYDNITIDGVSIVNLGSIDKTTYIDGGKALTVQSEASGNQLGTLKARYIARGCVQGFGFESNLNSLQQKKVAVDIDLVAEHCFVGVIFTAPAADSGELQGGAQSGIRVKGHAINCQKDVILNRCHGIDIDLTVVTTVPKGDRVLNPLGRIWTTADQIVETAHIYYAKFSRIKLVGNKGSCDYKMRIGATNAGTFPGGGATSYCDIYFQIDGSPSIADIGLIESGGLSVDQSRFYFPAGTVIPVAMQSLGLNNAFIIGSTERLSKPLLAGKVGLLGTGDGTTETGAIDLFGLTTGLQGKIATGGAQTGLFDNSGNFRLGVSSTNGIFIDALTTSGAVGAYVGKFAVYSQAGGLIGYFPIYS